MLDEPLLEHAIDALAKTDWKEGFGTPVGATMNWNGHDSSSVQFVHKDDIHPNMDDLPRLGLLAL
jgi:hypothetical protein